MLAARKTALHWFSLVAPSRREHGHRTQHASGPSRRPSWIDQGRCTLGQAHPASELTTVVRQETTRLESFRDGLTNPRSVQDFLSNGWTMPAVAAGLSAHPLAPARRHGVRALPCGQGQPRRMQATIRRWRESGNRRARPVNPVKPAEGPAQWPQPQRPPRRRSTPRQRT